MTQQNSPYNRLSLLNAVVIGFMVGTYEVMGRGGTQAIINMSGQYVGREILRFAAAHGEPIRTPDELCAFLIREGLTNQLELSESEEGFHTRIAHCRICPKKVGRYSFDGTACPWGGILAGALEQITGQRFSCTPRLTPGDICEIDLRRTG